MGALCVKIKQCCGVPIECVPIKPQSFFSTKAVVEPTSNSVPSIPSVLEMPIPEIPQSSSVKPTTQLSLDKRRKVSLSVKIPDKKQLEGDFSHLKYFSFEGEVHEAKVLRVIDADTLDIVHIVHEQARRDALRLYGFDAPEKRPRKNSPLCEIEKQAALAATEVLQKLLVQSNNIISVKFHKPEKYGRQLGEVFLQTQKGTINIQKWMVEQKIVKPYFGKKKEDWVQDELQFIINRKAELLRICEQM